MIAGTGVAVPPLVAGVLMVGCWLVSLPKRDVSIVDPLWPMVFVVMAWSLWLCSDGAGGGRAWLMLVMVSAWGVRLGAYLTARKWGAPEDFRYQALRRRLQPFWLWSLLVVFGLQAALAVVVSLPVQAVLGDPDPSPLWWLDWVGAAIWAVGLAFESVSDEQLRRFNADAANRGKVMDRGLWRYSRHPNYFGDSMVWWGLWVVAAAAGAWWTVAGPLVMTILLLRVSGVTVLERSMGKRRPGYAEYAARTSTFVPMPPRRISRHHRRTRLSPRQRVQAHPRAASRVGNPLVLQAAAAYPHTTSVAPRTPRFGGLHRLTRLEPHRVSRRAHRCLG